MFFCKRTSPNFGNRAGGVKPSMLILHYTDMKTGKEALDRLCDPKAEVSSHYFIEESGKIRQLVADDKRAWHAGKSFWDGETDINSYSIGIEIVNPGHTCGYREFPEKQIRAVIKLCKKLVKKYGIAPANVLAHSDIAPERKLDPGELFPWQRLAESGIGLWSDPNDMDAEAAQDVLRSPGAFVEFLISYGYNPQIPEDVLVRAFHRHFYPEKIINNNQPEQPDITSIISLLSLLRQKHASQNLK